MIRALHTAATGMDAQQQRIDVISNNLANVNTTGFKKQRADFQDLLYQTMRAPGTTAAQGTLVPSGVQVGTGVRTASTHRSFTTGDLMQTGNDFDLAIEGNGFFQVTLPGGKQAFTRAGNFERDQQGQMVTTDGAQILYGDGASINFAPSWPICPFLGIAGGGLAIRPNADSFVLKRQDLYMARAGGGILMALRGRILVRLEVTNLSLFDAETFKNAQTYSGGFGVYF